MVRATDFFSEEDYNAALDEEAAAHFPDHWSNHFATYADACHYYGADTVEDDYYDSLAREAAMDDMEANGVVPYYRALPPYAYEDYF